jgi:hypothetical protein
MRVNKADEATESKILAKGLVAPRVSTDDITEVIVAEQYYVFPDTTTTVCCLTLKNGYSVIGTSACASPENFDQTLGEDLAYEKARDKIWALEGYRLKQALYDQERLNESS